MFTVVELIAPPHARPSIEQLPAFFETKETAQKHIEDLARKTFVEHAKLSGFDLADVLDFSKDFYQDWYLHESSPNPSMTATFAHLADGCVSIYIESRNAITEKQWVIVVPPKTLLETSPIHVDFH